MIYLGKNAQFFIYRINRFQCVLKTQSEMSESPVESGYPNRYGTQTDMRKCTWL